MSEPLSDERFLEIIRRSTLELGDDAWQWYGPQAKKNLQALVNEVVRLRGILYDAKAIHVELRSQASRLAELLKGEGGKQD